MQHERKTMLKNTQKKQNKKKARKVAVDEEFRLMTELLKKDEKLHPDLAAVLDDEDENPMFRMISHPLLHVSYNRPALHNYQYKVIKEHVAEAKAKNDWIS